MAKGALEAKQAGRLEEAATGLEALVEAAPELVPAHLNLGLTRHEQGEYAAAAESFRRALELQPDLPDVRPLLGFDLVQSGRFAEAVEVLEQATKEKSGDPEVGASLGVAYLRAGRLQDASEQLERAARSSPDDPEILRALAELHARRSGEFRARLLGLAQESPAALHTLAEDAVMAGAYGDATALYERILELAPGRPGVRVPLGDLHLEKEDYAAAEALYREAARREPGSARAFERWGESLLLLGESESAVKHLERALELDASSVGAAALLGKALSDLEKWARAEQVLVDVTGRSDDVEILARAHYQLAQIYRRTGRTEEARRALRSYAELRGGDEAELEAKR